MKTHICGMKSVKSIPWTNICPNDLIFTAYFHAWPSCLKSMIYDSHKLHILNNSTNHFVPFRDLLQGKKPQETPKNVWLGFHYQFPLIFMSFHHQFLLIVVMSFLLPPWQFNIAIENRTFIVQTCLWIKVDLSIAMSMLTGGYTH